jgi:hypothetical protein
MKFLNNSDPDPDPPPWNKYSRKNINKSVDLCTLVLPVVQLHVHHLQVHGLRDVVEVVVHLLRVHRDPAQ